MNAQEHIAASVHYFDRIASAPESEVRELMLRSRMHNLLARRPELAPILPRLANHPRASVLLIGGIK